MTPQWELYEDGTIASAGAKRSNIVFSRLLGWNKHNDALRGWEGVGTNLLAEGQEPGRGMGWGVTLAGP